MQRGGDLALAEIGAVVAVDRERDAAGAVDVARPREGVVERRELLEQELVLLQRCDALGAARTDIDAVAHGALLVLETRLLKHEGSLRPCGRGSPC